MVGCETTTGRGAPPATPAEPGTPTSMVAQGLDVPSVAASAEGGEPNVRWTRSMLRVTAPWVPRSVGLLFQLPMVGALTAWAAAQHSSRLSSSPAVKLTQAAVVPLPVFSPWRSGAEPAPLRLTM